jgi:hypothetical protein
MGREKGGIDSGRNAALVGRQRPRRSEDESPPANTPVRGGPTFLPSRSSIGAGAAGDRGDARLPRGRNAGSQRRANTRRASPSPPSPQAPICCVSAAARSGGTARAGLPRPLRSPLCPKRSTFSPANRPGSVDFARTLPPRWCLSAVNGPAPRTLRAWRRAPTPIEAPSTPDRGAARSPRAPPPEP